MRVALYARVSKALEQNPENQMAALREWAGRAGAEIVGEFIDEISSKDTRPQKEAVLGLLRTHQADAVAFYALDRWGRNMAELVLELEEFSRNGWVMMALKEQIDLSSAAGKLFAHVLAAMANFERERIRERTLLGLARARAQGKRLGRPRKYPFNASWSEKTTSENRVKHEIRKNSREAGLKGKVCVFCGSANRLQIHHLDYDRPDFVITLCDDCHFKAHGKRGGANPPTFHEGEESP